MPAAHPDTRNGPLHSAARAVRGIFATAPFTAGLWLVVLGAGIATGTLAGGSGQQAWLAELSYGLPSFSTGNWFTTLSGMFILAEPAGYLSVLVLIPLGVGWLEATRGTRTAVLAFFGGHLASVLLTAATLLLFRDLGSAWIDSLANDVDSGPSGGIFACLTLAACHVRQPWRGRWQFLLLAFAVLGATLFGEVPDLEHSAAILLVLVFKHRSISRPNLREQRFIAWVGLLGLVSVQILTIVVPTHGPFGPTHAGGGRIAVLLDAALAIGLARGLRSGRRIAWLAALVMAVLNVLRGALGVSLVLTMGPQLPHGSSLASLAAAVAGLWLLLAAHLLVCWRAFGILRHRRLRADARQAPLERAEVVTALKLHGGGTLSWMGTWDGNEHHRSPGGSLLAYQVHAGCAIALSDPVGPAGDRDAAMEDFSLAAEEAGLIPCFFSASAPPAAPADRWRAMQIARDTLIDLPQLEFAGKAWSDVRTALNRAARERVGFRLTLLIDEPAAVRRQLEEISSTWVGDKSLPQLRFTLGTLTEAEDPAVRVALAVDAHGQVQGFLSWLPVHAPGGAVVGWTLDLMRRREGGFGPVMEFLIASSLRAFAAEGEQFASLSGAPLAHTQHQPAEEPVDRVLGALSRALEPLYGFGSLQAFKAKFNPRTVPLYLVYRDESDLPRIAGAMARAFVPEASVGQLVREGFGALRELRGRRRA
ncbi:bifunctional lysylphosphatidylglycerol flippase/synthetase MprF [Paeniglutamicibacter sp.]|uniref:bifunctional lysylphosphatidylglycerol flippase/synthetase MprF n=1 Tax=Paeniglutamicibacter sp. TaxID=1934391 RepID=UPI003988FB3E